MFKHWDRNRRTQMDKSVLFDVWLPGQHPGSHTSTLTLRNITALHFFLEAVARGHSMFFGQPFDIVALNGNELIGAGSYTVTYSHVDEATAARGVVNLFIHGEQGLLLNFMRRAWFDAQQSAYNRKQAVTLDDIYQNHQP